MARLEYDDDTFEMLADLASKGDITPATLRNVGFDIPFEDQLDIILRSPYIKEDDLLTYFTFLVSQLNMEWFIDEESEIEEMRELLKTFKTLDESEKNILFANVFSYYMKHRIIQEFKSLHIDEPGITPVDKYSSEFINKLGEEILEHFIQITTMNLN